MTEQFTFRDGGPVRLCCLQRHFGPTCPDGQTMCELCFHRFPPEQLYQDRTGIRWSICQECASKEVPSDDHR